MNRTSRPLVACSSVEIHRARTVDDLISPVAVDDVFTAREQRFARAGRGFESWAGRLAAKRAVASVLERTVDGTRLVDIEIVPSHVHCPTKGACSRGHPPDVVLHGRTGIRHPSGSVVTISHAPELAIAVATTGMPIGVDVIELARARNWIGSEVASRRLFSERELAWCGESIERRVAALALKECSIKIVGRRPPKMSWRDATVTPSRPHGPADSVATSVAQAAGAQEVHHSLVHLDGRLVRPFGVGHATTRTEDFRVAGAWCATKGHVVGVAWVALAVSAARSTS